MATDKSKSVIQVRIIVILLIGLALIAFVFQNRGPVQTRFLFFETTMPQAVVLLLTAAASFIAGSLMRPFSRR